MSTKRFRAPGFTAGEETVERTLTYQALENIYSGTPGLPLDKIKAVLEEAWAAISGSNVIRGVVFAYDEAQKSC